VREHDQFELEIEYAGGHCPRAPLCPSNRCRSACPPVSCTGLPSCPARDPI
jgi:hypothetical protein